MRVVSTRSCKDSNKKWLISGLKIPLNCQIKVQMLIPTQDSKLFLTCKHPEMKSNTEEKNQIKKVRQKKAKF